MTEHVHVLYRAERDVREWATRHAAGEVPGRWPYGLDELAHWGLAVEAENIAQPTRLQSGVARVVPPSGRRRGSRGSPVVLRRDVRRGRRDQLVERGVDLLVPLHDHHVAGALALDEL